MPIIFSVVAQGNIVLARHATCEGNFDAVTEHILAKIQEQNDALTYSQWPFLFHYIRVEGITYMCFTNDAFQRARAFNFLLEIKRRFQNAYNSRNLSTLPHVINTEFSTVLANQMLYSTSNVVDMLAKDQIEFDELDEIMTENIDNTQMDGEHVRLLVNDANENRTGPSGIVITREQARTISYGNITFWLFFFVAHAILIYGLGALICGPSWKECGNK